MRFIIVHSAYNNRAMILNVACIDGVTQGPNGGETIVTMSTRDELHIRESFVDMIRELKAQSVMVTE